MNTPAATYPECWPGTAIIKSRHNPFNWRLSRHEDLSIFAATSQDRTPLFSAWLQKRASAEAVADWPAYRDAHAAEDADKRAKRMAARKKPTTGIGGHNGTIAGLSKRAEQLLQPKPDGLRIRRSSTGAPVEGTVKPMHVVRAPQPAAVAFRLDNPRHGGAYTKAKSAKKIKEAQA